MVLSQILKAPRRLQISAEITALKYVTAILILFAILSAASSTHAIEYQVGFSYDTSLNVQEITNIAIASGNEANVEETIELKNPNKVLQLPWIKVSANDIILETDNLLFKWRTSLGYQYGKIEAPSGFYLNTGDLKIDFIEPSMAESQKYQLNVAVEIIKNLSDVSSLYSGVGFKYDQEKVTYSLGDWDLRDYHTATMPQLYLGLNYKIFNDLLMTHINCQATYDLRNDVNLQCGIGVPLN